MLLEEVDKLGGYQIGMAKEKYERRLVTFNKIMKSPGWMILDFS